VRRIIFELPLFRHSVPHNAAVLITGTSTGMGKLFTYSLAEKGLFVFAGVRNKEDGAALLKDCPNPGFKNLIVPIILDVTNSDHLSESYETVVKKLKETDRELFSVINNAGIQLIKPVELQTSKELKRVFEVNTFGVISICKTFIPLLRRYTDTRSKESKTLPPTIIIIGSIAGIVPPVPFMTTYSASKYAIEAYADGLRCELKGNSNIGVHLIQPGSFKTNIIKDHFTSDIPPLENMNELEQLYGKRWSKFMNTVNRLMSRIPQPGPVVKELNFILFSNKWIKPIRTIVGLDSYLVQMYHFIPDSINDLTYSLAV